MNSALARERIGDAAVAARTGKKWAEWYRALDAAGARQQDHRGVVALVGQIDPKVAGWWRQMIAVSYEQACGKRRKHERPDGYQVSASKTVAVPVKVLYRAWKDPRLRAEWLADSRFTLRKATADQSLRITWGDGKTLVEVAFYSRSAGKAQVTVQHRKLPSAAAGRRMQSYWKAQLAKLASLAGQD